MLFRPGGPLVMPLGALTPASGGGASAAYTNFIARTSGLDATHLAAYQAFFDGLTADGLFNSDGTSDYFDVLYLFATQDQTTALLSLVNNTFAGTNANALTFTADAGFTADDISGHYIDLGFNPATATSPKYTQNSAHLSIWNLTNSAQAAPALAAGTGMSIYPKFSDNNLYLRVNDNPESGGFAVSDPRGHHLGNRSSSTARQGYLNGASIGSYGSQASQAPNNAAITACGAAGASGGTRQTAMASAGGDLVTLGKEGNFYTRTDTFMTAVGVP